MHGDSVRGGTVETVHAGEVEEEKKKWNVKHFVLIKREKNEKRNPKSTVGVTRFFFFVCTFGRIRNILILL